MRKSIAVFTICLACAAAIAQDSSTKVYYKNSLMFKPFNISSLGLGMGIMFERYLDNTNNFSITIPVNYVLGVNNNNQYYYGYVVEQGFEANPGFRFYFVEPRKFNWYIGTSVMYGITQGYSYDVNLGKYSLNHSIFGSIINVGFKGTIKERFTYNVDMGNGIRLLDKYSDPNYNYGNNKERYLGSFHVGFGYNF